MPVVRCRRTRGAGPDPSACASVNELASHLDLLLAFLTRDRAGIATALAAPGDAIATFGAFARRNQLSGFLHAVAGEAGVALPVSLSRELGDRSAAETRKRRLLQTELGAVVDACRAHGLECIVLKGPELASRFYGTADQRVYWDLDLLVRRDALPAARQVLEERGYVLQASLLFGERISLAVAHALDYAKGEIGLDLHWKLSNHPSFRVNYDRLWSRRVSWVAGGQTFDVLSPDYEITLNLLAACKDLERGALRMRSFVDLWMILQTVDATLDWDRFLVEREEERIATLCGSALAHFLLVFQAAGRFPNVSRALAVRTDVARVASRAAGIALLEPAFLAPGRRLWASQLYQTSRSRHLAWWALTLPVRLTVHKPGKMKRFTQHIRSRLGQAS